MSLESALLKSIPGITHGFGTREEPLPTFIQSHWEKSKPVWKQVHGVACAEVQSATQFCGDVDALWTQTPGLFAAIQTADCVPVLLAAQDGSAAAAVHAGWRGTFARILPALATELQGAGHDLKNWVAAIGPCIGPCCYKVSEDLAEQFRQKFGPLSIDTKTSKTDHLDLASINAAELKKMGLASVEILSYCTQCNTEIPMHSYRREGTGYRQWSVIKLQTNV